MKMQLEEIINKIDMDKIYDYVLNLEGVRHPIDTPDDLDKAADYIRDQMKSFGISVREQEFQLEGLDNKFRNIEGYIGDDGPSAVIVAHYDTVFNSPGANDDASGISVILECARVLSMMEHPPNVRFLAVSLEEGNPILEKQYRTLAEKYNITDERHRYTSATISHIMQKHSQIISQLTFAGGKSNYEAISEANSILEDQMPEDLKSYLKEYAKIYSNFNPRNRIGNMSRIGSSVWVDEALKLGKKIRYYICLDEIGTTFDYEHSQTLPEIFMSMIKTYRVDLNKMIANFEMIVTNSEENNIVKNLLKHCKHELIDLPYGYINMNMNFDQIVENMPKALSSDHAPFIRAGIPGVFIFDTSILRHTFIHSPGDTIDKLNFNLISKICKAITATLVEPK